MPGIGDPVRLLELSLKKLTATFLSKGISNKEKPLEQKQPHQDDPSASNNNSTKLTGSLWRQLGAVAVINMVTFLQGASLSTSSISTIQLPAMNETLEEEEMLGSNWPKDFSISVLDHTLIGQSWLFGHLISSIIANPVAEVIGRKNSLIVDAVVFGVGFVVYACGESTVALCLGRALLGYPLVNTVYMCELVHPSLRGISAAIFIVSHSVGYSLILLFGALMPWRVAIGSMALITLPVIASMFFVPESPIWLLRGDKVKEAASSLRKIRGPNYDSSQEMEALKLAVEANNAKEKVSPKDLLRLMRHRKFLRPFSFLVVIFSAFGWSGFVYIALNGVAIFESTAVGSRLNEFYLNFLVSLIKIPGGLLAAFVLKKYPRRPIFITAALVVTFGHFLMGLTHLKVLPTWCALIAMTLAFLGYSAGYNSVGQLLLGELLPANLRSIGVGLICSSEVLSSLSQIAARPYIESILGKSGLFFIFASVVLTTLIFAIGFMPETNGLTLEEIESKWQTLDRSPNCTVRRDPVAEYRRFSMVPTSTKRLMRMATMPTRRPRMDVRRVRSMD